MKIKDILSNTEMVAVCTPNCVINFIEGKDLVHKESGEYISKNTLCFELSNKTLLVTDRDRNYLFVWHSYCSQPFCFCSKGWVSQVHHENLRKFRYELWEKFMDRDYQTNEYGEITEDTVINIPN